MNSSHSQVPFVTSVLFTLAGTIADNADKFLPAGPASGTSDLIGCGLVAAGGLAGNVLAGFLYDAFKTNRKNPAQIAQSDPLRLLVAQAIRGTIEISGASGKQRKDFKKLAEAAEIHWPIFISSIMSGPLGEFTPEKLNESVQGAFSGQSRTVASQADWEEFLAEAVTCSPIEIEEETIRTAAESLHMNLREYLGKLATSDAETHKAAYEQIVLKMLSELLILVRENQSSLMDSSPAHARFVQKFLRDAPVQIDLLQESLNRIETKMDGHFQNLSEKLDGVLTVDAVSRLKAGGRKSKKEASRLMAQLSGNNEKNAKEVKELIAELILSLSVGEDARSLAEKERLKAYRLIVAESARGNKVENEGTRRTVIWTSCAVTVIILLLGFFAYSALQKQSNQNSAKLEKLFETSKIAMTSSPEAKTTPYLSRLTGYSESEIHEIIETGKLSKNPVDIARAFYLSGENERVLSETNEVLSRRKQTIQPAIADLANMQIVRALALLKSGKPQDAIREFRAAWSAWATIGATEQEMDTKLLAAAALFRYPDDSSFGQAGNILLDVFNAPDHELGQIWCLFGAPGCCPEGKENEEFGWMTRLGASNKEDLVASKAVFVKDWSWSKSDPGFYPYQPPEPISTTNNGEGSTATTTPVGYIYMPQEFIKKSPVLLDQVIAALIKSPYFGESHPYLMILYINGAEVSFALGDRFRTQMYATRLCALADKLIEREEQPAGVVKNPSFEHVFNQLLKSGFIPPRSSNGFSSVLRLGVFEEIDHQLTFGWLHNLKDEWYGQWPGMVQIERRLPGEKSWVGISEVTLSGRAADQPFISDTTLEFTGEYRARYVLDDKLGEWSDPVFVHLLRGKTLMNGMWVDR